MNKTTGKQKPNYPKYWAILALQKQDQANALQKIQKDFDLSSEQWNKMQDVSNRYITEVANIIK